MRTAAKAKVIGGCFENFNKNLQKFIDECTAEGLIVTVRDHKSVVYGEFEGSGGYGGIRERVLVVAYKELR